MHLAVLLKCISILLCTLQSRWTSLLILIVDFIEVRQEAVQQALAQAMQNRHKPSMPMPSKRTSVMARSPDRDRHDSGEKLIDVCIISTSKLLVLGPNSCGKMY